MEYFATVKAPLTFAFETALSFWFVHDIAIRRHLTISGQILQKQDTFFARGSRARVDHPRLAVGVLVAAVHALGRGGYEKKERIIDKTDPRETERTVHQLTIWGILNFKLGR